MEADFQREYGIDLSADILSMSWRRFAALVRGLSPDSALVNSMTSNVTVIDDPEEAERVIEKLWR